MNPVFKGFTTFFVVLTCISLGYGLFHAAELNYFQTAPLTYIGLTGLFLLVLYLAYLAIRGLWAAPVILIVIALQACSYAKSNQQVVVSEDCGSSWKSIQAGDAVPREGVNPCYMKVVMPNFPMQGESKFIGNFGETVRANVHLDYDYSITSPLNFIRQAKYLGKANKDADSNDALDPAAFEGAENAVIDKNIREVCKAILLQQDIVDYDQAALETEIETKANARLEAMGIRLNFITLTFDLDEQTRQAIDVATAMKVYASKGIAELGEKVIAARAGAPKVVVENHVDPAKKEEE